MLNILRKRRAFAKIVLWVLIIMISVGMIAVFGNVSFGPPVQQQSASQASSQEQAPQ